MFCEVLTTRLLRIFGVSPREFNFPLWRDPQLGFTGLAANGGANCADLVAALT